MIKRRTKCLKCGKVCAIVQSGNYIRAHYLDPGKKTECPGTSDPVDETKTWVVQ